MKLPANEPVLSYAPGSKEQKEVLQALHNIYEKTIDIPMVINGKEVFTDTFLDIRPPHDHGLVIARHAYGDANTVKAAIASAQSSKALWASMNLEERSAIFLKAADLLAKKYRALINAATMAGQSKNVYQAEIDAACELIDFLRFNVAFAQQIYDNQPISPEGITNKLEYRPLEGFVFAVTPFNFTAIAANLPCAPALMGNTVVWKPTESQIYAAHVTMNVLMEAGLPNGVINMIFVPGPIAGDVCLSDPNLGGIHFTGSTKTFKHLWKQLATNLDQYQSFPVLVGETGGKDFVLGHSSANVQALATALLRGAFEYQGQKCSAASRAYISASIWPEVKEMLLHDLAELKMGPPEDTSNFINAVIDERAYDRIVSYIDEAKRSEVCKVIAGGNYSKETGYFIEPTVIVTQDPMYRSMLEEIFGPVLTIFVYEDQAFEEVLDLIDSSTEYALTGAVFSEDDDIIRTVSEKLQYAAGNFYINDKPTGAVVAQQPFGGARMSGTNDKAGAYMNLLRWVSPRTIKTNHNPPEDYRYPFME